MRKKPKMHARRTLASLIRAHPPKVGGRADYWCKKTKYKASIVWDTKQENFFRDTMYRHGFVIDSFDRFQRA